MLTLPLTAVIVCVLFLVICGAGSYTWAAGIAASALAVTAITVIRGRHVFPNSRESGRVLPGIDAVVMTGLVLLTLSAVPMPLKVSATSGPAFYEQNRIAAAAVSRAAELKLVEPITPRFSYSRNRFGTQRIGLTLVLAFLAAALTAHFSVQQKTGYLLFLALAGAALAVTGILALTLFPQGDTLWWRFPIKHGLPGPVACFVNRNYFAGCMAMLSAASGGLAWYSLQHRHRGRALVAILCLALMTAALATALSRGAIVAYVAAAGFFLVMLVARRRWVTAALVLALVLGAAVAVVHQSRGEARERLQSLREPLNTASAESRLHMWRDALAIWSAHPLAGVGADGFRMVYPQFRTTSRSAFASHAENLYVQALCETGLVGVLTLALLVLALVRLLRSPTVDHAATRPFLPATTAAVIAVGVHSFFDSPLLIPLNAMLAGSLLGLSLSIEEGVSRPAQIGTRPYSVIFATVLAVLFGLVAIPSHRKDSIRFCRSASAAELAKALPGAPSSWMHWYYLGRQAYRTRTPEGRVFSEACITRAAELDPNNYKIWRELGELRLGMGNRAGAAAAFRRVRELGRDWVNLPPVPGHNYELAPGKEGGSS
jgi:O-antigen ligase